MSIFAFIWHTLLITPQVMIRYLPYLLIYGLIVVGIQQSTENVYVIGIVMFLMNTYGIALLFTLGIRGALIAVRATQPAVAGGILNATTRILFFHMLLQLLLLVIWVAVLYALFAFVLGPNMAPTAMGEFDLMGILAEQGRNFSGFSDAAVAEMRTVTMIIGALYVIGLGGIIAIFGVPMAAVAANAVQHSPKNDMIFGMGRFWLSQAVVYWMFNLPPVLFLATVSPDQLLYLAGLSAPTMTAVAIAAYVFMVFAGCASYSAMAIGYELLKTELAVERRAQAVPDLDYDAERETLKSLRAKRTAERSGAALYDPRMVAAPSGAEAD